MKVRDCKYVYGQRWEGFKEGSMFILDLIKRENEKRENEEVDTDDDARQPEM